MSDSEFKLIEDRGDYTERWTIDPPALGVRYQVIRSEWNAAMTERTILEIRVVDAS